MFIDGMLPAVRKRLVTIGDNAPLLGAAKLLALDIGLVVVCDADGVLAGVITKTDVVRQIGQCQGAACTMAASTVMSRNATFCHPGDFLHEVWSMMRERGLKNVPVVDSDSRPIGVLNARDALEGLLKESEHEESLLREYVMCVGYH